MIQLLFLHTRPFLIYFSLSLNNDGGKGEEALLRANRRMAHRVGYGMLPEDTILLATSIDFGQIACATDMSLFGYDQGVFSKKPVPTKTNGYQLTLFRWCRNYQGLPSNSQSRGTNQDHDFINGDSHLRCWMFLRCHLGVYTWRALWTEEVYSVGNHYYGHWHGSTGLIL